MGGGDSIVHRNRHRQRDPQRAAFGDRGRHRLVAFALVEQDDAQAPAVERCCKPPGERGVDPLGHRHDQRPARGLGEQPARRHRPSGGEGRGKIDAAEQAVVGDSWRQAAHRPGRGGGIGRKPRVARWADGGANDRTAEGGVGGEEARGKVGVGGGIGQCDHVNHKRGSCIYNHGSCWRRPA